MMKKLSLVIAAVAALAFAIPAMADASKGLTSPPGTLVPVGTVLVGTSTTTPTLTESGAGNLTCNKVELKGKVTQNSSTGVAGNSSGQSSTAINCFINGARAFTVDGITIESASSSAAESGLGKVTASYVAHIGTLNCKYQLTNVTATYTAEKDLGTLTKQPQTVTPAACGAGGTFDAEFTLETLPSAGGKPIFIMS